MQANLQKPPQIKILPVLSINDKLRLREEDIDDVVKTLQGLLPRHAEEDMDITITLLEKNLKIMADMTLMKEALVCLVRNAMDTMPGYGTSSLTINEVNFAIESLLNVDDSTIGACAFISLAGGDADMGVDGKMKETIHEPFFTTQKDSNGLGLAIAYRMFKQHQGRIKAESRAGRAREINIYLPLTKPEIMNMMSIPGG